MRHEAENGEHHEASEEAGEAVEHRHRDGVTETHCQKRPSVQIGVDIGLCPSLHTYQKVNISKYYFVTQMVSQL